MADYIYINQPWYPELDTNSDLTSATLKIRIKSPVTSTVTLLDATEMDTDGWITAKITGAVNNEAGRWEIRPWVLFSGDDAYSPGKPFYQTVREV